MREPIISVSGLRGVVGDGLNPLVASRYVAAFLAELPPGSIVLSRDGRDSGPMLRDTLQGTIAALGRVCLNAEVAATPTTGVLVRQHNTAGGVQISASHNPPEYNGIKLFGPDGRVVSDEFGRRVMLRYQSNDLHWVMHDQIRPSIQCTDTLARHLELVRQIVDVPRIRRHRFRVLLDANHGAGSLLGRALLEELGCRATLLGETPDGNFSHAPEPTAENLAGVLREVPETESEIGFCQDPDADRLAVIDEQGCYLGEEYTPALCVDHVLRTHRGAVVTNCATSRMAEDLAEKYGVAFHRSAVGEAHVCDAMLAHRAVLGGEGNGGIIDPRVGYVRDSFVGMALLLDAMAARQLPISRLADELPRYEIVKTKIALPPDRLADGLAAIERHFSEARPSRLDGLRLDWPDRWLLVRASNTEPIVRAIAEAKTEPEAAALCRGAAEVLAEIA